MEVNVSVGGISYVVCGVTEETTCEEVVEVLAQALGPPGPYMLQEKFKDVERCMTPNEQLLETLEKYGEAREVQLTLLLNGPPVLDGMRRTNICSYQPCPPLRQKDAGATMWLGSGSLSLNCQSLPQLPCSRHEADQPKEDTKRRKKKYLTLMEEALEWLEYWGKGKVQCQMRGKESKYCKKTQEAKSDDPSCVTTDNERNHLKNVFLSQLSCLQDLEAQIDHVDKHIFELEEKQRARGAEQEAQWRMSDEEIEQIMFWENELKAEEHHEKNLQCQCQEMRKKAVEYQAMLEEYKHKIQELDFFATQNDVKEDLQVSKVCTNAATEISIEGANQQPSDQDRDLNVNRQFLARDAVNSPSDRVPPGQIKEWQPTGPPELGQQWTSWPEPQITHLLAKKMMYHSELTIYLSGTKDETKGMSMKMKENLKR